MTLNSRSNRPSRRQFVKTASTAAGLGVVGGAVAHAAPLPLVHNQDDDQLRVGLIGCGGRGTGAAINAANADSNVRVTALADAFGDRINDCAESLGNALGDKLMVDDEHKFTGLDCYKQLINSPEVDVVLMCSPPHFRPMQMEEAVKAGKHVFCEKPVAVDPVGVRRVRAACEEARKKGLNVVSGLCWRYDIGVNDVMKRIQDGAIGEILSIQENYLTGTLWHRGDHPRWTDMEYQLRNWLYYTWLSGDLIAEQHIHSLDKALWLMGDKPPKSCYGVGGRLVRDDKLWGNVYDHFACCFEWENGVKTHSYARQMKGCFNDVNDYVVGTEGTAKVLSFSIDGKQGPYKFNGKKPSMYDVEHVELFKAIRAGAAINNGEYMCDSTLMAIIGRQACYTGKKLDWDEFAASDLDLSPPRYELGEGLFREVAKPGTPWPA